MKRRTKNLANTLSIKHLSPWKISRDESHRPKVITAMDCHAKMFRESYGCRELSEFSLLSHFDSVLLNSPSSRTNEIKFPVSFELKRAVDFPRVKSSHF